MTGARLTAVLARENDVGGRFTIWRSGDSHGTPRVSVATAASCAFVARPRVVGRADQAVVGATPRPEGLVRARG